jgi:hypothetical protein
VSEGFLERFRPHLFAYPRPVVEHPSAVELAFDQREKHERLLSHDTGVFDPGRWREAVVITNSAIFVPQFNECPMLRV